MSPQLIFTETATLEQSNRMSELAAQAKHSWLLEGHPGWSVIQDDSQELMTRIRHAQVTCRVMQIGSLGHSTWGS